MGRTSRQTQAVLPRKEFLNEVGLIFGARYASAAVLPDGPAAHTEDPVQQYVPSAAPGCRAPHVWVTQAGEKISTLDLLGRGFVLLTAAPGSAWRNAAARQPSPRIASVCLDGNTPTGCRSMASRRTGRCWFGPTGMWRGGRAPPRATLRRCWPRCSTPSCAATAQHSASAP